MKKMICIVLALMLLTACSAPGDATGTTGATQSTTAPTVTNPPVTDPPITEPPITQPPITEPPVTEPPVTEPPVEDLFEPHESFDVSKCGSLLGTWSTKITLSGELQNLEMFTGRTEFTLYYTFDEEGRFCVWADQTEFNNAIDEFEALMIDHMVELRFETFRGPLLYQGVEEELILERWGSGPEQDARNACEESVAALNLYHRFRRLIREGQYYVNSGKLYTQLSEERFESNGYAVNGNIMSLNNTNNMSTYRDICVNFPLIFQKSQ